MRAAPSQRTAAFTGAGVLLVAIGLFVNGGWPFVIGGFVLLVAAAGSR